MENANAILAGKGKTVVCATTNVKYLTVTVMASAPMASVFAFVDSKENSAKKVNIHLFIYSLEALVSDLFHEGTYASP